MSRITRYSHLEHINRFRSLLVIVCLFYVVVIMALAFVFGQWSEDFLWAMAGYLFFSFALSLTAIHFATFSRLLLLTAPVLLIVLFLALWATQPISTNLRFMALFISFTVVIGLIAAFTLHQPSTEFIQHKNPTTHEPESTGNSAILRRRAVRRENTRAKLKTRLKTPRYRG